jgi:glyoxylase-like metal-dependent hydrolase (beta-lactamase superfamily II)
MKLGRYEVSTVDFGTFRLDGGSMFGSVPKNIWGKRVHADDENCIALATRSLLLKDGSRTILVDVGMGEKWNEKSRQIFAIKNTPVQDLPFERSEITDIVLTHLHFDHAGGISEYRDGDPSKLTLTYPKATVHLQRSNFENGRKPGLKERASYLKENIEVLLQGNLNLVDGDVEVLPGLWVCRANGHTVGQQWIELRSEGQLLMYPTDLIPTSHHLPVPFHMGYDICAGTVLSEKERFLSRALEEEALVVFQHDPELVAATVAKDERGHYVVRERHNTL